jgi:hypothetical protein
MISELWNEGGWSRVAVIIIGATVVSVPILIGVAIVIDNNENKKWADFKVVNNCKIVGHITGNVATTIAPVIGGNGQIAIGTTISPDKTGWKCDDGITYWR